MMKHFAVPAALSAFLISGCSSDPSVADYPPGPYGVNAGDIIENVSFRDLNGKTVDLKSLYRGSARALVIYATGTWCFSCRQETDWLNAKVATNGTNIVPVAVLLENNRHEREDATTGGDWVHSFGVKFLTLLDPNGHLDGFRTSGVVPLNLVIDTSTMRIVQRQYEFDASTLDAALARATGEERSK